MQKMKTKETSGVISSDLYDELLKILSSGDGIYSLSRTYDNGGGYRVRSIQNPITQMSEKRIVIVDASKDDEKYVIVPRDTEIDDIIKYYSNCLKEDDALQLYRHIKQFYSGVTLTKIVTWMNLSGERNKIDRPIKNVDSIYTGIANKPMDRLQIDIIHMDQSRSPTSVRKYQYKYILMMVDVYSQFLFLRALQTKKSSEIVKCMMDIFYQVGKPGVIQVDNGIEFQGKDMALDFMTSTPIIKTPSHVIQTQQITTTTLITLKSKIECDLKQEREAWAESLSFYMYQYNTRIHKDLCSLTPFQLFYGRQERISISEIEPLPVPSKKISNFDVQSIEKNNLLDINEPSPIYAVPSKTVIHKEPSNRNPKESKNPQSSNPQNNPQQNNPKQSQTIKIGQEVTLRIGPANQTKKGIPIVKGIIEVKKGNRYKIRYMNKGKPKSTWFPETAITRISRDIAKIKRYEADKMTEDLNDKLATLLVQNNKLEAEFKKRGLKIINIEGDGNCFFRAVAHILLDNSDMHHIVRSAAIRHIIEHLELYREFIPDNEILGDFIVRNAIDFEWSDNIMIQATTNAYNTAIEIVNETGVSITITPIRNQERTIVLGHVRGLHYVASEQCSTDRLVATSENRDNLQQRWKNIVKNI